MRIRSLILVAILFLFSGIVIADPRSEGEKQAKEVQHSYINQINTSDKINTRISKPMTDGSAPLETLAKTPQKIYNAALTTKSSIAFLQIEGTQLPSGDMAILVKSDFGFTGAYTQFYTAPVHVSSVCVNGIISCNLGTSTAPAYFNWHVDDKMNIQLLPTTSSGVAGCYCVNQSCGPITDTKAILAVIGGAVVGAIQSQNPRLVATKVESTSAMIRYYGQDSGHTTDLKGTHYSGPDHPEELYTTTDKDTLSLTTKKNDIVAAQMKDPNSPYRLVSGVFSKTENPVGDSACVIRRTLHLTPQPIVTTSDGCAGIDLSRCKLKSEIICDYDGANCVETYASFNPTLNRPETVCKVLGSWTFCNDGATISDTSYGSILSGKDTWYHIERIYQCQDKSGYDFKTVTDRVADVESTTTLDTTSGGISYSDKGASTYFAIPKYDDPDCEKVCKIRKFVAGTDVTTTGKVSDYRKDTTARAADNPANTIGVKYNTAFEYVYVPWEENPDPTQKGRCVLPDEFTGLAEGTDYEFVVADPKTGEIASCKQTFNETMSVLQGIRAASDDMICSKK